MYEMPKVCRDTDVSLLWEARPPAVSKQQQQVWGATDMRFHLHLDRCGVRIGMRRMAGHVWICPVPCVMIHVWRDLA